VSTVVSSWDPNYIQGPSGFGPSSFVKPELFSYAIEFENERSATAPAQTVVVTQQLHVNLDWSTFQLGSMGFGNTMINVPSGQLSFSTRVDLTAAEGIYVDVNATFNPLTGLATWTFTSIDPATLDVPADPLAGFLPPDTAGGNGIGFVSYTIRPISTLTTGATINAQASVLFDMNGVLTTAQILNTIDALPPTSSVDTLPATSPPTFAVTWSGQDDSGGSGIASYTIFVSDNGGPFTAFVTNSTATSATFSGVNGDTYSFYSVATDNVGNQEATPNQAQATTLVGSQESTTTTLTSDQPTGSVYGQVVTFTATVSPTVSEGPATGSVQFQVDGNDLGSPVSLSNGAATMSTAGLTVGAHTIDALYSGDSNFLPSTGTTSQIVNQDTTTIAVSPSTNPSDFGEALTLTATVSADAPGSGTPTGSVDFFDTTTATDLGSVSLSGDSASLATPTLPVGSQTITFSYSGDSNFLASNGTVTVTIVPSIYVLNATVDGALALTGSASINIPGLVQVNSTSARALAANGNAQAQAGTIQVVGGFYVQDQASVSPSPVTGVAVVPDPLVGLPSPVVSVRQRSVDLTAGSLTIDPGIYFQIAVAGTGSLTLNPGVYVIIGGGFSVTQSASVTGSGVVIYNAGSNYVGYASIFGGITLTGQGAISLTPASTGPYAGVVIYQSRDNPHDLNLSASAALALTDSIIYAPAALLNVSGNAFLQNTLVVDRLHLGVAGDNSQTADRSSSRQQAVAQIPSSSKYLSGPAQGSADDQIVAILAGSEEYFQKHGNGTQEGFFDALYQDELKRRGDAADRSAWDHALTNGSSRAALAAALFASTEYQHDLVQSFHQKYLAHSVDSTGLKVSVNALLSRSKF
jgi:hypothetical protein